MNESEQQFFNENGYLVVRNVVAGIDLERLTQELASMQADVESGRLRGNHLMEASGVARVVFNPYDHCPSLRHVVGLPSMVGRARAMLGCDVALDHSKLMCKPARQGTPQPPHQDFFYWQGKKANQVAVFLCIDPSTIDNGCLRVFPGTHRLGLLDHHQEHHPITGERHWVCQLTDDMVASENTFIAEPGDAIFFHSLTIHRSEGNQSDRHRRAVIFEYDQRGNLDRRPGWGTPIPAVEWLAN